MVLNRWGVTIEPSDQTRNLFSKSPSITHTIKSVCYKSYFLNLMQCHLRRFNYASTFVCIMRYFSSSHSTRMFSPHHSCWGCLLAWVKLGRQLMFENEHMEVDSHPLNAVYLHSFGKEGLITRRSIQSEKAEYLWAHKMQLGPFLVQFHKSDCVGWE